MVELCFDLVWCLRNLVFFLSLFFFIFLNVWELVLVYRIMWQPSMNNNKSLELGSKYNLKAGLGKLYSKYEMF